MVACDALFAQLLLSSTGVRTFADFQDNNRIIPAYFNVNQDFLYFLNLLAVNNFMTDKHIVLYLSGTKTWVDFLQQIGGRSSNLGEPIFEEPLFPRLQEYFFGGSETNIKTIEVISPQAADCLTIPLSATGQTVIRIFTGYVLSSQAYDALYQLSFLAGVSGDNTFERCVSMQVLPYYWSTNYASKRPSLAALSQITQAEELAISEQARRSYQIFFRPDRFRGAFGVPVFDKFAKIADQQLGQLANPFANHRQMQRDYASLDFPEMIKYWPIFCHYLMQYHNFYNQIDNFLLDGLPAAARPIAFRRTQQTFFDQKISEPVVGANTGAEILSNLPAK